MAKNPDKDKKKIIVLLASAVVIVTVAIAGVKLQWFGNSGDKVEPLNNGIQQEAFYDTETHETVEEQSKEVAAIVEESREKVDGGEIVKFSDGTTEFISNDTIVPEIVDIETLEEMGLREPEVKEPEASEKPKETYDNPIIQADSETYIEYLGETMSLKDYYEEIAQVDPESLVRGGNIERLIAYNPDWASEHGYSLDDVQQPEPEKPATTNIEENHITPAPDPSLIEDTTSEDEIPQWAADRGLGKPVESVGIDWGSVPPELRPTFK